MVMGVHQAGDDGMVRAAQLGVRLVALTQFLVRADVPDDAVLLIQRGIIKGGYTAGTLGADNVLAAYQ